MPNHTIFPCQKSCNAALEVFTSKTKTWKGEMIKKWLQKGQECDTCLTHIFRYPCSFKRKRWKQEENRHSTAYESHSAGWKLLFSSLSFEATRIFTDMSQVGVALTLLPFVTYFWLIQFLTTWDFPLTENYSMVCTEWVCMSFILVMVRFPTLLPWTLTSLGLERGPLRLVRTIRYLIGK